MRRKHILNSPKLLEIRKKRRKILKQRVLVSFGVVVVVFIGLCFISRIREFNIKKVEVSGNKVVDTDTIQKIVEEQITGNYLWFIPKTNFLLYPRHTIERELADQYKRLSNIKLDIKKRETLRISLEERTGIYTWCGSELPNSGEQLEKVKCYFLDKDGYIFDVAPFFSGDVYFKFFGQIGNITNENTNSISENPAGNYFLPESFHKIVGLVENIKSEKLRPMALYTKSAKEMEIYLESQGDIADAPKIIFTPDADLNKLAENLDAAISAEPLASEIKNKYESLQYIDLRFGNKVYYKFK